MSVPKTTSIGLVLSLLSVSNGWSSEQSVATTQSASSSDTLKVRLPKLPLPNQRSHDLTTHPRKMPVAKAFGNVAVIEDDGTIAGHENLFDLDNSTLRFSPLPEGGYRVEKTLLLWETDIGDEVTYDSGFPVLSREVTFSEFSFPFGNKTWTSMVINSSGSITFGWREDQVRRSRNFLFDDLARRFVGGGDLMIAPLWHRFLRSTESNTFFNMHRDRVVVTWDVTERFADPIFFLRGRNRNQIQVVLFGSGEIRLFYNGVQTLDGIVGVFPGVTPIPTQTLSINVDTQDPGTDAHLDILEARAEQVDSGNVQFSYELRGPVPEPKQGLVYRFFVDVDPPFRPGGIDFDAADCVVSLHVSREGDWEAAHCGGLGAFNIDGNSISVLLPLAAIDFPEQFKWFGDAVDFNTTGQFDQIDTLVASPTNFGADRELNLSDSLPIEGAVGAVFESFHYELLTDTPSMSGFPLKLAALR